MNGKQAKKLRRAAMGLATSLSEAGREIHRDGYLVKTHGNRYAPPTDGIDQPPQPSYQVLVRPDSFKGIYKALKSGKA